MPSDGDVVSTGEVGDAMLSGTGGGVSVLSPGARPVLAVVAPVCSTPDGCDAVGVTTASIDAGALAQQILARPSLHQAALAGAGVAIFDLQGHRLAAAGRLVPPAAPRLPAGKSVRHSFSSKGDRFAALYSPLELSGRPQGTIAVTLPTANAFASVRAAAWRVALLVLLAIAGVAGIGGILSRYLLAQVTPLLRTNRLLGSGDLSARAPVLGDDELGELARGVNHMAEQLQASYENLEERVRDRTREVERLLTERTDLFASISHEFRTPLAIILAQAASLRDASYAKTDEWCDEVGRIVEASGQQLLSFVNDVLELARAESEGLQVGLDDVRLPELVQDLRGSLDDLAVRAGVRLRVKIRSDVGPVRADPQRLRQIIVNLVDNAVKYTPTGGRVELNATSFDGRVAVTVSDTGVGIPPDVGDHVFEPFYRVAANRTQRSEPSSGLGLAVTRRLVEAQGGAISYAPRPGGGTTFSFTLVPA